MRRSCPEHLLQSVQKAVNAIEENLRRPLELEDLARHASLSFWHFQRVFRAVVGEPVASYLRRRRLTVAAHELRSSQRPILEIALALQFESHETFTRAFRAAFNLTPTQFRRSPRPLRSSRARLDRQRLEHFQRLDLQPVVVDLPARSLAGLSTRYLGVTSERRNDNVVIPELWGRFRPLARKVLGPSAADETYGAWDYLPGYAEADPNEFAYLAAVEIRPGQPTPPDWVFWHARAGRYARFTHRGPASRIGDTISYIYAAWLPRSEYERGDGFDYKHFDARFRDQSDNSELDYYLPLRA